MAARHTPASNSVDGVWFATVGSHFPADHEPQAAPDSSPLTAADILSFVDSIPLTEWAALFTQVPNDDKRRKEALAGALQIKAGAKRFDKVVASLLTAKDEAREGLAEAINDGKEGDHKCNFDLELADVLIECQAILHEVINGLLEVSFPIEQAIADSHFKDALAVSAVMQRTQTASELAASLAKLFAKGKRAPQTIESKGDGAPLPPEVLNLLEKSMQKQKKKEKKKGVPAVDVKACNLKAARTAWEKTEGCYSSVLGEEVWTKVSLHRGMFYFGYLHTMLHPDQGEDAKDGDSHAAVDAGESTPSVSRSVFADAMRSFRMMLTSAGPIAGDLEDPVNWQVASDGGHQDETARMFYHGVYSGTHLRGLKHLAEISYWQWKHDGMRAEDAKLAALINRKFVHVVRHIMPHAGWTADIEYDRIVEMEEATLSSSEFSNGLKDKQKNHSSNANIALVAENSKGKTGKTGGYAAGKGAKGSAVSSTSPAFAAPSDAG